MVGRYERLTGGARPFAILRRSGVSGLRGSPAWHKRERTATGG